MSVSPTEDAEEAEEVVERQSEEEWEAEMDGEVGERLSLKKDEDVLKRLVDTKLPTKKEMEDHRVMGARYLQKLVPDMCQGNGERHEAFQRERAREASVGVFLGLLFSRRRIWD